MNQGLASWRPGLETPVQAAKQPPDTSALVVYKFVRQPNASGPVRGVAASPSDAHAPALAREDVPESNPACADLQANQHDPSVRASRRT